MPQLKSPRVQPRRADQGQGAAESARGTVILPFGRYFAARADLLAREGFKTLVPIDGVSPFSGVGDPDAALQHLAVSERANARVAIEVRKDLAARLADAGADFLVVDNSAALLYHREIDGRFYAIVPREPTDLMDMLWNADEAEARQVAFKISHRGFTDDLRSIYDGFVRACLDSFDPAKIILVRSHVARFSVADGGSLTPINRDRRDAQLLDGLDDYFLERTGCRVAESALGHFPSAAKQSHDHRLRRLIEDDLVELCTSTSSDAAASLRSADSPRRVPPEMTAVDHVVEASRSRRPVDWDWLEGYFAAGRASFDDMLTLAYLKQRGHGEHQESMRRCVRAAVADPASYPSVVTRRRFDRSVQALRGWPWGPLGGLRGRRWGLLPSSLRGWRWGSLRRTKRRRRVSPGRPLSWLWAVSSWWEGAVRVSPERLWTPEIAVPCGSVVFRFLADGSIRRVRLNRAGLDEAAAIVDGRLPVTPLNLLDVLGSWPVYLERGRRGFTGALQVVLSNVGELVDSCSWIDWAWVLDSERVVITTEDPASVPARTPPARTDLSFIFDPNTRIGTVGGGLTDQVAHIALFDDLCRPQALDLYLDDFRYTWWRSHNGFEASRLAPDLDRKRITKLVSPALIESFRSEVPRIGMPWVYSQSRTWYEFGLREATVVTFDSSNSRPLLDMRPEFPVLVYHNEAELGGLISQPPTPVCFYTTQHRIPIRPESAVALRRVFGFHHLEANGLDPDVARTADLLRSAPHVAFHVRRGDYLHPHFDTGSWHARQDHYIEAIDYLIDTEFGTTDFNVAVFSDDLNFVEAQLSGYGLDRISGQVRFIRGNRHYNSIFDAYLMSLCPFIVGSVGKFAATTSLLADPPSVFIRARPGTMSVEWRR